MANKDLQDKIQRKMRHLPNLPVDALGVPSRAPKQPPSASFEDGIDGIQEDDRRQATHSVFNWRYFYANSHWSHDRCSL